MKPLKKFYIVLLLGMLSGFPMLMAQATYEKAAAAYRDGNFSTSIELYESIIAQSVSEKKESAEVYYNLGNAYFRNNQVAKAILNYERALLLNPGDNDIRHNLRFARTQIEDKIDVSGSFFLSNLWRNIVNLFNSNTWAYIGIVLFVLFLVCIAVFLFIRILWLKKSAFYAGIVLLVLMIFANAFAFTQKNARVNHNTGIVMSASASVMASPDSHSKELFRLHEGTKVTLNKADGNWCEIEIANGSVGWTTKDNIETI